MSKLTETTVKVLLIALGFLLPVIDFSLNQSQGIISVVGLAILITLIIVQLVQTYLKK